MSAFQPAPSPFAPQGTAFAAPGCRCHVVVAEGRALVSSAAAGTALDCDGALAAIASSRSIVWEGAAADLFRERLDGMRAPIDGLDVDAGATLRLADTAGA
ncbi:hypothetical protein H7U32_00595 [Bifidobacterium pullorum subsp. saeculare]|uniref:Uncharacterized protein n=1 Tax=Bifidobacterium pullorum subsp. saeculare TaxID=78257 RepID=A0A938WVV7_9BIFI|nr:hypothetical protein [Bifidobacterium pullorum]MBM6698851.1 hypothetical protein [Bifidobacterium pullorum subsp. saeculare]